MIHSNLIHSRYFIGALFLVLSASWAASYTLKAEGQPTGLFPLSDDFQVNTYTTARQTGPDVAFHDQGFVVAWPSEGSFGTDADGFSVQARRFTLSGDPLGDQFQVNVATGYNQSNPRVATWQDGRFVVVWQSQLAAEPFDLGIVGRLFASSGTPVGGELVISTDTAGTERGPAVRVDGEEFVVVWSESNGASAASIQLQRFDSAGARLGTELQVNTTLTSDSDDPEIAGLPGGDFVVVWSMGYYASDPFLYSIRGQRFDSTGSKAGGEFQVDDLIAYVHDPDIAVTDSGEFMVVWRSSNTPGDGPSGLVGRMLDNLGDPLGASFQVNQRTGAFENDPAIATLPDGTFQVVWSADDPVLDDVDIVARIFDSAGSALTGEFVVNSFTTDLQFRPRLAVSDAEEAIVATWMSRASPGDDSDETSVLLRRFRNAVFVDGFESGDTSAWSVTVN